MEQIVSATCFSSCAQRPHTAEPPTRCAPSYDIGVVPQSLHVIHEDSRDTWRQVVLSHKGTANAPPSHCFRDDSSCRHSPNTTTIRRKERCKCCRQSKERSHAELASGWQMNWGSISSRRGPFIFALCVTRVVWEAFVRRGKSLPSRNDYLPRVYTPTSRVPWEMAIKGADEKFSQRSSLGEQSCRHTDQG